MEYQHRSNENAFDMQHVSPSILPPCRIVSNINQKKNRFVLSFTSFWKKINNPYRVKIFKSNRLSISRYFRGWGILRSLQNTYTRIAWLSVIEACHLTYVICDVDLVVQKMLLYKMHHYNVFMKFYYCI